MALPYSMRGQHGKHGTLVVWRDVDPVTGRLTQHTRTWPRALPGHRTSCRIDASKGLRQHRCSVAHRELVDGYRAVVRHEEQQAEAATHGYDTELADYWRDHPRTTFRDYLTSRRHTADAAA